jgi:hypothetical protein
MKKVHIARDPGEAGLIKGILENEGIEVEVQGEWLFAARGEVAMTSDTLPSLWVINDSDFDRATELVAAFSQPQEATADAEDWQCGKCGEQVEPQFGSCWNCGAERKI